MSFSFKSTWNDTGVRERMDRIQREVLTEAAADGETMLKSPHPTGWPRRTGFLASSSGFNEARKVDGGWQSEITVDAEYWPYVERRTQVFVRAGEAIARTIGPRIARRSG